MSHCLPHIGLVLGLVACNAPTNPGMVTGLEGTARRGPIQPVCQPGQPCDGPLTTRFDLLRGTDLVATFRSDANGHFLVRVAPGTYLVVPDASAPLLDPRAQAEKVAVGTVGITHVDLEFDTGIR
jgi:hypothetical protein